MSESKATQNRPAHVTINVAALRYNLAQLKTIVPDKKVMAVIKADGYGHGMEFAAEGLAQADEFAVNSLDDVTRLRANKMDKPLTLLSALLTKAQFASLPTLNVRPVLYDWTQLDLLQKLSEPIGLSVWIKVDTGMGRLGFQVDELPSVMQKLQSCQAVSEISLMTHLANADNPIHSLNQKQIDQFGKLCAEYDFYQTSILNSAGILNFSASAFDVVRPGIALYGISPMNDGHVLADIELQPAMSFKSRLLSVKALDIGDTVGYGSRFVCTKPTTIGVVACGYGDGYPRHAEQGTPILVNGMFAELVGRVSMDMLTVDITGMDAKVGDEVELWGENLPIESVAEGASSIAYELICGVTSRVQKVVIRSKS